MRDTRIAGVVDGSHQHLMRSFGRRNREVSRGDAGVADGRFGSVEATRFESFDYRPLRGAENRRFRGRFAGRQLGGLSLAGAG